MDFADIAKKRWLPISLAVVVPVAAVALFWYSGTLKEKLREKVSKEVQADLGAITGAGGTLKITYQVPKAGVREPIEYKFAPNEVVIGKFKEWRDQQQSELSQVVNAALEFNRGNRKLLLDGIFPEPAASDLAIKPLQFREIYLQTAHKDLLKRLRAGSPQDPAALAQELKDKQTDLLRAELGKDNPDWAQASPELQTKINRQMLDYRLGRYADRAKTLSFYCDVDAFRLPQPQNDAPSVADCFKWQWEYWVREDILSAIAAANAASADQGVPGAVIKKVEVLTIEPLTLAVVDPSNPAAPPWPPGSDALTPFQVAASLTQRVSGPNSNNSFYDIRKVSLDVIAETSRLPAFIDALAATNFMNVLDCDLYKVDMIDEIKNGYCHGDEPVVRAKLQIETLWLREWMIPMVPKQLRLELLMPDPPPPPGSETPAEGTPPAAPAPAPAPGGRPVPPPGR